MIKSARLLCRVPMLNEKDIRMSEARLPASVSHSAWLADAPVADDPGEPARPTRLHITHNWGGGVAAWVADFAAADPTGRHLVLRSVSGGDARCHALELLVAERMDAPLARWPLDTPIDAAVITQPRYRAILDEVIAVTGATALIVSSLVGHALDALDTGLPTLLVQHDYYPWCPALFLHFDGVCASCGRDRLAACLAGNPDNIQHGRPEDTDKWLALREHFTRGLLAEHVIWLAPSDSVFRHLIALEPRLAAKPRRVIGHGLDPALLTHPEPPPPAPAATRLRVLVLGRLPPHKGQELLRAALPALLPRVEFVLVGCGVFCAPFEGLDGVHLIADYRTEQLAGLIDAWRPDCALVLSLVPETFSYTLSELMALAVPPLATRVGALADRVEHGVNGLLFEPDAEALIELVTRLADDPAPLRRIAAHLAGQPLRDRAAMVADYLAHMPPADPARTTPFPAAGLCAELLRAHDAEAEARRREAELRVALDVQAEQLRQELARECEQARQAEAAARERENQLRLRLEESARELEAERAELAAHANHIAALDGELAARQAELAALRASTSWRVTAPLRWLSGKVRAPKNEPPRS